MKVFCLVIFIVVTNLIYGHNNNSNQKEITIYYDFSLSCNERNIEKELSFMSSFFSFIPEAKVKLIAFNTEIILKKNIQVEKSNISEIKEILKGIVYDGASNFDLIDTNSNEDYILLFSDGNYNIGNLDRDIYSPKIITVSSQKSINYKFLHETGFYSLGYFVDLDSDNYKEAAASIIEGKRLPKLQFFKDFKDAERLSNVNGIVLYDKNPIENVKVLVKGKSKGTITNYEGKYSIDVSSKDTLIFSGWINKKAIEVPVNNEKFIYIDLGNEDIHNIEPVIIKSKSKKVEYETIGSKKAYKNSIGFHVSEVDSDEITAINRSLGEAMAGEFGGLQMGNHNNAGLAVIRGMSTFLLTNHPLFIIDGIPLPRSGVAGNEKANYDFIDPNNIANIKILRGLAATNIYGSEGNKGVILITTKTGSLQLKDKPEDTNDQIEIKLKDFTATKKISKFNLYPQINFLNTAENFEISYERYLKNRSFNFKNVSYYVGCANFFFEKGITNYGRKIILNLLELFPDDTSILKIATFILHAQGLYEDEILIHKRIIEIAPQLTQTYIDLAKAYRLNTKFQESEKTFLDIINNKKSNIDFKGIQNQVDNELKYLVSQRNQKWSPKNIPKKYFILPQYDLRITTEWSYPQTEFEIKYISPSNKYFSFYHNKEKNEKALQDEIVKGYTSDEFIMNNIERGEWYMSVANYDLEKTDEVDKFLKVTIDKDFGTSSQSSETFVIDLKAIREKDFIFTKFKI